MKRINIFAYNSDNDPLIPDDVNGDLYIDGKEFITGEISDEAREKVDALESKVDKLAASVSALSVKYLVYLPAVFGMILCVLGTKLPFPLSTVSIVVGLCLFVVYAFWQKNVIKRTRELTRSEKTELSPQLKTAMQELEDAEKELLATVGFNGNAIKVDVLHYVYDGEYEPQNAKDGEKDIITLPAFFEVVGETLKISELYIVLDIPFSCVKSIERVNRKGSILKLGDEDTLPSVMPSGVTVKKDGYLTKVLFDHLYVLVIEKGGTEYEIAVPPYCIDKLTAATGLAATSNIDQI